MIDDNGFTAEERAARAARGQTAASPQDPAQVPAQTPANQYQALAQRPGKVLAYIWMLLAFGIFQRVVIPAAAGSGGVVLIAGTLVLLVIAGPPLLAGSTLYYNRTLSEGWKAGLIGSAAVTTIFGIYLLAWALS